MHRSRAARRLTSRASRKQDESADSSFLRRALTERKSRFEIEFNLKCWNRSNADPCSKLVTWRVWFPRRSIDKLILFFFSIHKNIEIDMRTLDRGKSSSARKTNEFLIIFEGQKRWTISYRFTTEATEAIQIHNFSSINAVRRHFLRAFSNTQQATYTLAYYITFSEVWFRAHYNPHNVLLSLWIWSHWKVFRKCFRKQK